MHHAGLRSAAGSMISHCDLARIGFIVAACLGVGGFASAQGAHSLACSGPPSLEAQLRAHPDADAYIALGVWFDRHQQWECADRTIRSGLKIAPDSARLNYLLGFGLYSTGQAQEAIAPLRQAVHIDPDVLQPHLLLAAALARLGDNREALGEWQAALKIDPSSKEALDGLVRSLIATGDYDTAIQALRSTPPDEKLTFDLATAYKQAGMYDEAAQALNQGLESFPDSDALTGALVALNVDESHFEAATLLAEKIARRKPTDLEAQRIYFRTLVITGDNDRAATLGKRLLALAPHDADLLNLNGLLEQKAGDFAAARKHLEEAVALSPNDYNPRVNLGVVLAELKDAAGARTQFEKAIELGTDEPQVHFELAKVLRTLGDMQAAQRQLELYQQKLKEKSDLAVAVSKATEAAEAVKSGDNAKAADLYRQACAAQPQNAALAFRLAMVLDSTGDANGERTALEQAVKANPHFAAAQYQLGYMDFQAGDNAAAEREFRATVEEVPDNVQAWISLASALGAEMRLGEARAAVARALQLQPGNAAARELSKKLAEAQDEH